MQTKLFSLDNIKKILEKDGFRTSWVNPFMEWQRPDLYDGNTEVETGKILYVRDFPIPWIMPFDLAMVSIRIDDEGIFFELSLYYVNVLEFQIEASVFHEIYDLHKYWHDNIVDFFSEMAEELSLRWDTEHDYYIEDTLFGHLKSEETALNILTMLKNIDEIRTPWVSWEPSAWSSDFPEVDCELKKYRDHIDLLNCLEQL